MSAVRAIEESVLKEYAQAVEQNLQREHYYAILGVAIIAMVILLAGCCKRKKQKHQRRSLGSDPSEKLSHYEDDDDHQETEGEKEGSFILPDLGRPRNALSFFSRGRAKYD